MIAIGLLIYATSAYFSGSLNILLQSSFLKRKKMIFEDIDLLKK